MLCFSLLLVAFTAIPQTDAADEANPPPVIEPIDDKFTTTGQEISFDVHATDMNADDNLRYVIDPPLPPGVTDGRDILDRNTGHFSWTPDRNQIGVHPINLRVWDGQSGNKGTARQSFTITVEGNPPPVIEPIENITVYAYQPISFDIRATDINTDGYIRYILLDPLPRGIDSGRDVLSWTSGRFNWTPDDSQTGVHTFNLLAWDGQKEPHGRTTQIFTIRVLPNPAPVVDKIADISVVPGQEILLQVNAVDVGTIDSRGLNYILLDPLPPGEDDTNDMLNWRSGYFRWTPDEDQRGLHTFKLRVWDGQPHPHGSTHKSFNIAVNGPVLGGFPTGITIREHREYTFDASFVAGVLNHTFGIEDAPDGVVLDPVTGIFSWTPSEDQGGQNHTFRITAVNGDGDIVDGQNATITVAEYNPRPVIEPIADMAMTSGQRISFYINATDIDTDSRGLRYIIDPPLPSGVADGTDILNRHTGRFNWKPGGDQRGVYTFNLRVWDGQPDRMGHTGQSFTITVNGPVLAAVTPNVLTIREEVRYTFDADFVEGASGYTFALSGEPYGATVDPVTGVFSWTPSGSQGGWIYSFAILAVDANGVQADGQNLEITVLDHNPRPVIEPIDDIVVSPGQTVSFQVNATDVDTDPKGLRYILHDPLPPGVNDTRDILGWTTGHFDWTPDEDHMGVHTINLLVWDGRNQWDGRTRQSFNITVQENTPPVVEPIDDIVVSPGQTVSFDVDATDTGSIYSLQYFLDPPLPQNMGDAGEILDRHTGRFEWTPDGGQTGIHHLDLTVEDDLGARTVQSFTITVNGPVLAPIPTGIVIQEHVEYTFVAELADGADVPGHTFGLRDAPDGAVIDPATGRFSWTPGEGAASDGFYAFTVTALDSTGATIGTQTVEIMVIEHNPPPVVEPVDDITVYAYRPVSFDVNATDKDNPGFLQYYINPPLPRGVGDGSELINQNTGRFDWTPGGDHIGVHTLTLLVWDGQHRPHGRTYQNFTVTVLENPPPVVEPVDNITVYAYQPVSFDVNATDVATADGRGLNYVLLDPLPPGEDNTNDMLNWRSGHFRWTPDDSQTGAHTLTLRVWDGQPRPHGRTDQNFTITVLENPPPVIDPIGDKTVSELRTVSFNVNAHDTSTIGGLQYFYDSPLLTICERRDVLNQNTGYFYWRACEPGIHTFTVRVWDGQPDGRGNSYETFTITVRGKVLAPIPTPVTIPEHEEYVYDVDFVDGVSGYTFGLLDAPDGAVIDPATGVFRWTPPEMDGARGHKFKVTALNGSGYIVAGQTVVLIVEEANPPPVINPIDDIVVSAGQRISFYVNATDADTDGGLRYVIDGSLPPGVTDGTDILDRDTGHFDWTPGEDQRGIHPINLRVWDGQPDNMGHTRQTFTITVNGPVLAGFPTGITIPEHVEYTFDADFVEGISGHIFGLDNAPDGARIGPSTGVFSWTPSEAQGGHGYAFRVIAVNGDGNIVDDQDVTVTVTEYGPPPVVEPIGDKTVHAEGTVSFYVNATDIDAYDHLQYFLESPLPPGVGDGGDILDRDTGHFDWTPGREHEGVHTIGLRVHDGDSDIGNIRVKFNITVLANPAPDVEPIENITASVGQGIFFQVNATDEGTIDGLNYIILDPLPPGVGQTRDILDWNTGYFSWTPGENQRGIHTLNLRVWDGQSRPYPNGRTDQSFTISVSGPVLAGLPTGITIPEQVKYAFDADFVAGISGHTFGLDNAPAGAEIDPVTGVFSWTPSEDQGGSSYTFRVTAVDGDGATADRQDVTIKVTEHNPVPVIEPIDDTVIFLGQTVSFYINATDIDTHSRLQYFVEPPLPPIRGPDILDRYTGYFNWTPHETGVHTVNLRVWDGQPGKGNGRQSFTVTVEENPAPVIKQIGNITGTAGREITFDVNATDISAADNLRYIIDPPLPPGVTDGADILDRNTGRFSWTPDRSQLGVHTVNLRVWDGQSGDRGTARQNFTITVNGVVLGIIPTDITIPEQVEYTFDADFVEGISGHIFGLDNAPDGARIGPATGVFSWTPSELQGGRSYAFRVVAVDGDGNIVDGQNVTATVTEHNLPPVIDPIDDITVSENQEIAFYVSAADPDTYGSLQYTVLKPLPPGVADGRDILDRYTGHFSWTPDSGQAGVYPVTVGVWDGHPHHGSRTHENFTITVKVNQLPVVEPVGDFAVSVGQTVSFNVSATDMDPVKPLLYYLDFYLPPGVGGGPEILDPDTGYFEWTPDANQTGTHTFYLHVSDGQPRDRGVTRQEFRIAVNGPVLAAIPTTIQIPEKTEFTYYVRFVDGISDHTFGLRDEPDGATINATTGLFSWTPPERRNTAFVFGVVAFNGTGDIVDEQTMRIVVTTAGRAPVAEPDAPVSFRTIEPQSADEGDTIVYEIPIDNPNSLDVAWSVSSGQTGDAAVNGSGFFVWNTGEDDGSDTPYEFGINATADGITVAGILSVVVNETNENPAFDDIETDQNATVGEPFWLDLNATDGDIPVQTVTYGITGQDPTDNPAVINRTTGEIAWTPAVVQNRTITVQASDDYAPSGTAEITLTVRVSGQPPLAIITPVISEADQTVTFLITPSLAPEPIIGRVLDDGGMEVHDFGRIEPGGPVVPVYPPPVIPFASLVPGETHTYQFARAGDTGYAGDDIVEGTFVIPAQEPDPADAPIAVLPPQPQSVPEGGRVDHMIPVNNTDNQTITWTIAPDSMGADITADGRFVWTPGEEHGGDTYEFEFVAAAPTNNASGTISVAVTETNENPVFDDIQTDRTASVRIEFRLDLNATDADEPPQTITYAITGQNPPDNPAVINGTTGLITWTPATAGTKNITVQASDDHAPNGTASLTIAITITDRTPANTPPAAAGFDVAVDPSQTLEINLAGRGSIGDAEQDAATLTVAINDNPPQTQGNASVAGTVITYTARDDAAGSDTISYTVTDSGGLSDTAAISITISERPPPANTAPVLDDIASVSVSAGRLLAFAVRANDTDGDPLTFGILNEPQGAAINATTGYFSWTPDASQTGDHPITVTVSDGQDGSDSQVFTVTVLEAYAGPNQNPAAPDILINAELFFPSAVTPAVTDPDGDDITITRVSEPALGVLDTGMLPQISYTPNQTGIERLSYAASDSKGGTDTGTITIFINPEGNARPVLDHIYNTGGRVGVDLEFTATAGDSDDTSLTFDIANAPDGASITPGGDFSWRPTSSQNGTHLVTFIVHDDSGGADWQHVTINVLRADETNLPPVPQDIEATVVLGGGRGFQPDISDPENDGTEITRVYDSSLGDVDRSFTSQGIIVYVAGVLGNDEVVYTVSDGRGGFANGTISITVEEPANVRPLIEFIGDKSVNANNTLTFTVVARDLDGVVTGFDLAGAPEGASMTQQGIFSWAPTEDDVGRYEFAVIVFDDAGENSTEPIAVTVRPADYVNSPPVAPEVVIMTPQDVLSISRPTLTDPDEGDPVRISQTGDTTKGRILSGFLRAGIIIYLPNQGESGTETITYTVSDSSDDTDTATINVFISARGNTEPILGAIDFRNINAGNPLGFDLEAEDPDGDTISYLPVGAPDGIEISPEGAFSWTPTAADVGNHTFTIVAYDDRGGADSKSAVIRVLPAGTTNQAPNAPDSSITVSAGGSVVITPAISDPDGDRVTITDAVTSGTGVVIYSEDSMNYIHVATTPTETITYTVTDARGATSTGTITITIQ